MGENSRGYQAGVEGQSGNARANPDFYSSRNPSATAPNAAGQPHETSEQAKRSAAAGYAPARQTITDAGGQAQRAATNWIQQTRAETDAYVRAKPWNAICITAGIGFLVGVILRR